MFKKTYDVIVVGGGHAGSEAAAAAATMGSKVLLITMNLQNIGQMSCNPAMGGIAKGQIIREIDALGGTSGIVSDLSAVQYKMLNKSKGPAMWSPRVQSDRMLFASCWRIKLEKIENSDFYQDTVSSLLFIKNKLSGVKTTLGVKIMSKSVILTSGTFLNGLIHIGEKQFGGGRAGERATFGITEQLNCLGFKSGRMKTGTPPRVDARSLDLKKMIEQPGDKTPRTFSYLSSVKPLKKQLSCYMTYTNPQVHDLLRQGFDRSPMFNGRIKSVGPRYCPSVEDKINRFKEKERHQIFVEPEGWNTVESYVNGFSTSLPEEIQYKALRAVKGFENVRFFRPGYAIEYDYFPPTQLKHTLETKDIKGLFFAGQINGTTGYEEAACQGIIAGINSHNYVEEKEDFVLSRDEAYIGVLIDDLITKGTDEPYRMFTSRAEYRMLLRQDNADERLTPKGYKIGLASKERFNEMDERIRESKKIQRFFSKTSIKPNEINHILELKSSAPIKQPVKMLKVLSRPGIKIADFMNVSGVKELLKTKIDFNDVVEKAEIEIKYSGYINKEKAQAEKLKHLGHIKIPEDFSYHKLASLSFEAKQKLTKIKPKSIDQASRVSGVSPSDISVLLVYMGR